MTKIEGFDSRDINTLSDKKRNNGNRVKSCSTVITSKTDRIRPKIYNNYINNIKLLTTKKVYKIPNTLLKILSQNLTQNNLKVIQKISKFHKYPFDKEMVHGPQCKRSSKTSKNLS